MNMREQAQTSTAVSNKVCIGTGECDTLEHQYQCITHNTPLNIKVRVAHYNTSNT